MSSKNDDNTKVISRRTLIKTGLAATAVLSCDTAIAESPKTIDPRELQKTPETRLSPNTKTVHSVCLACNARCGVRGVIQDGKLVNISGNPYHPYNMQFDPISYDTQLADALKISSPVCGKSLDTPGYIYNPYRILSPLKRFGPRGSKKFEPVSWDTLIREVSDGGRLFAHLGENRQVPGIKDLLSDEPIQSDDPSLGPKRNGLVFLTGRLQSGRKEFIDRFVKSSVGSKNRIGHTDICGLGFRMGNFALSGEKEVELKADPKNADYILVFGANIYEALQPGINTYGAIVARRQSGGKLSFSIVDPRATRASVHAKDWLPVKPGKDGALAMGIIRYMMEHDRVNKFYLSAPNETEVKKRGFGVLSNASHLVICDPTHPDDSAFLRMKHIDPSLGDVKGNEKVVFEENSRNTASAQYIRQANLDAEGVIKDYFGNSVRVKTAYRLLKEEAFAHSLSEYAKFSGVLKTQIQRVAHEFSSHGTRAAVTQYHGAGNYVNGTYAAYAIASLNALVGSVNMKGGYLKGGGGCGSPVKGIYDLKSFPNSVKNKGVAISREKAVYEKSAEYQSKKRATGSGYPAKRPWFAFTKGGLCVEALSGIDQQYPYPARVLFTYLFNPVYSIPGGYRFKETLADTDKVPLHISLDIAINESNIYADYIIPDLSFAEGHYGWLTPHAPGLSFTGIRSPMIEPINHKTPDGRPICTETLLIDLAKYMNLPGFGQGAIHGKDGKSYDLNRAEDFYLRAFANIADNAKIPKADQSEISYVESAYLLAKYKNILPEEQWHSVCHMLARGGVFKPYDAVFEKEVFTKGISEVHLYNENLAKSINSLTGKRFSGSPGWLNPSNSKGMILDEMEKQYPYSIITYKSRLHTQSRSLWSNYAMEIQDENNIEININDCKQLGLKEGDNVKLVSESNPEGIQGKVQPTSLIRPGCIAVSFHFGHSQFGGSILEVKKGDKVFQGGKSVMKGNFLISNPEFTKGLNFNDVALLDKNMNQTPMVDLVGGIPDFSSTRVKIIRET
ncbi:MAG: molybdopterin-dependent oxidoreductase [Proteobacteria bacterium]|nr:molybdopterin-dependent oxidoreductase [Pseudomonadota bacterium]